MDDGASARTPQAPDLERRLDAIDDRLRALDGNLGTATTQQRERDDFLRRRAGWILLWAAIAALGSCSYSSNETSTEISRLRQSVEQLAPESNGGPQQVASRDDVLQLCYELGSLRKAQGRPAPTADDAGSTTACFQRATEGFQAGTPRTP